MRLKALVGSGEKILLLTLPFLMAGLALSILFPSVFHVGGPSTALRAISILVLIPGVAIWIWSGLQMIRAAGCGAEIRGRCENEGDGCL